MPRSLSASRIEDLVIRSGEPYLTRLASLRTQYDKYRVTLNTVLNAVAAYCYRQDITRLGDIPDSAAFHAAFVKDEEGRRTQDCFGAYKRFYNAFCFVMLEVAEAAPRDTTTLKDMAASAGKEERARIEKWQKDNAHLKTMITAGNFIARAFKAADLKDKSDTEGLKVLLRQLIAERPAHAVLYRSYFAMVHGVEDKTAKPAATVKFEDLIARLDPDIQSKLALWQLSHRTTSGSATGNLVAQLFETESFTGRPSRKQILAVRTSALEKWPIYASVTRSLFEEGFGIRNSGIELAETSLVSPSPASGFTESGKEVTDSRYRAPSGKLDLLVLTCPADDPSYPTRFDYQKGLSWDGPVDLSQVEFNVGRSESNGYVLSLEQAYAISGLLKMIESHPKLPILGQDFHFSRVFRVKLAPQGSSHEKALLQLGIIELRRRTASSPITPFFTQSFIRLYADSENRRGLFDWKKAFDKCRTAIARALYTQEQRNDRA